MIHIVAEDNAVGEFGAKGSKSCIIGDVAGAEDEGIFFAVKLRQSLLQGHGVLIVSRNVSGPASSSSVHVESFVHGFEDVLVATHTQVIVGAPDRDSFVLGGHVGSWKFLGQTVDVVEVAVGLVSMLLVQLRVVVTLIVKLRKSRCGWFRTTVNIRGMLREWLRCLWRRTCGGSGVAFLCSPYDLLCLPSRNTLLSTLAFFSAVVWSFFSKRDLTVPVVVAAFATPRLWMRALCTARALFMTGHRRAMNWRLVMVPPPGDWWVVVDSVRKAPGEVFFKKGHMPLD